MTADRNFKGDIGTVITLNAGVAISAQTTLLIKYKKPTGVLGFFVATVSGTDYATYTTLTVDDLDVVGWWEFQIYVVLPSGTWTGKIYREEIFAVLA